MSRTTSDLQKALVALGYGVAPAPGYPNSAPFVDGRTGPRTRLATVKFQRDHGLYADGIAGPKTWAKIEQLQKVAARGWLIPEDFSRFAPDALPNTREALEAAILDYPELSNPKVLDDWLGQMWVESKGFSTLVENLNYSVEGLRATFGKHRISDAECNRLGRIDKVVGGKKTVVRPADQKAIANIVYGGEWGRIHLGNIYPNDGWDHRGSGFKQITGRHNIEASGFTAEELRSDVFKAALAAAKFFVDAGCVLPALQGGTSTVTRKINGGLNGYAERVAKTTAARKVIR